MKIADHPPVPVKKYDVVGYLGEGKFIIFSAKEMEGRGFPPVPLDDEEQAFLPALVEEGQEVLVVSTQMRLKKLDGNNRWAVEEKVNYSRRLQAGRFFEIL